MTEKIDFEKEAEDIFKIGIRGESRIDRKILEDWGRSIAARVEEKTLQRGKQMQADGWNVTSLPRLYAPKKKP